jgi:hypothetical protein
MPPSTRNVEAVMKEASSLARKATAAAISSPEWTQWCIGQSGLTGNFAARSRAAALTQTVALLDEEAEYHPDTEQYEAPFRHWE